MENKIVIDNHGTQYTLLDIVADNKSFFAIVETLDGRIIPIEIDKIKIKH